MLGLDHTLITRRASVGSSGRKDRPSSTWNQLLTTGWTGPDGSKRFRFPLYLRAEHPPDLIARVCQAVPNLSKTWHGFRIREHQDLRRPQNTPIQMPTQMWVLPHMVGIKEKEARLHYSAEFLKRPRSPDSSLASSRSCDSAPAWQACGSAPPFEDGHDDVLRFKSAFAGMTEFTG